MIRASSLTRIAAATLFALPAIATAQQPKSPPAPAPVKPATIPPFQEATLANGLRILLVESKRQPVVSLALMLPAGDAYDPTGREGVATIVASVITKGAGSRTADQVSAAIEGVGGSIGAVSGTDFLTVRANVLANDAPLAFELLGDAVARPSFETKEVELARTQTLSALQLEQSQPSSLASRFFAAQLFGSHPYARRPTATSVRALTSADLRAFQRSRLVPGGALLVVAGDIGLQRARELAEKAFGSWTGRPPTEVTRPAPPTRTRTEIVLVHRPGSVQSNIVAGNLTYRPSSPAYYPLSVASRMLGGGSDGRLFKILREKKSWTYGAYSQLTRNRDIGTFEATAEVRNAVSDSALVELLGLVRDVGTSVAPADEVDAAKSGLVGSLPLQLETAQGVAEQVGRYTMLGLPKDFIRTLRPRLASVTPEQLRSAAKQYMRADRALIVVVGDGAQIYEKLARIAPTRIVNAQGETMTAADLVTRATALPVDVSKLGERADSFSVLVQGNPLGYQKTSLTRTQQGFVYRSSMVIGPIMSQSAETIFGADLKPVSTKGRGKVQGQDLAVDVAYANGRAKGTGMTPSAAGMKTVTIDTTIAPGTLDDNMITAVIPGLPWTPTAKFSVTALDASSGAFNNLTLAVTGTETLTVPAGTFPAYRVELTGQQQPLTFYVSTTAPHRLVKMTMTGTPLEFVLVK